MRYSYAVLAVGALGCSSPEEIPERRPGATFYLFTSRDGYVGDGAEIISRGRVVRNRPTSIGEEAVAVVFRALKSDPDNLRLIDKRTTEVREGEPTTFSIELPGGEVKRRFTLTATLRKNPVGEDLAVDYVIDASTEMGSVNWESHESLRPRGALIWYLPKEDRREYVLLLHVKALYRREE